METNSSSKTELARAIGWIEAAALVVGSLGSTGLFGNFPYNYSISGPSACLVWILTLLLGIVICVIMAWAFTIWPDRAGAEYAIIHVALGEPWGIITGLGWWISWGTTPAVVALILGRYIFGTAPETYTQRQLFAIAIATIFLVLNMFNIKIVGRAQTILSIVKVVPLVLVGLVGAAFINPANFHPFWKSGVKWIDPNTIAGMFALFMASALIASWSTLATDIFAASVPEIKDPAKNLPKTLIAITVIPALYILAITVPAVGVLGDELATLPRPIFTFGERVMGLAGVILLFTALVAGALGAINASLLAGARILYQMAKDDLLPKVLMKLNRYGVPYIGLIATYILNVALILYTPLYITIVAMTMVPFTVAWALVAFAAPRIKLNREWREKAAFNMPWAVIIAGTIVGIIVLLYNYFYGLLYGWYDILLGVGFVIAMIVLWIIMIIVKKLSK